MLCPADRVRWSGESEETEHPEVDMSRSPLAKPAGLSLLAFLAAAPVAAAPMKLSSPDGRIGVRVELGEGIHWWATLDGKPIVADALASMRIDDLALGERPRVRSARTTSVDRTVEPVVRRKAARLAERYRELRVEMRDGYAIVFRAYDDGIAYRFETSLPRKEVKVLEEKMVLHFPGEPRVFYPKEDSFFSHNERKFLDLPLRDVGPSTLASIPAVVVEGDGPRIAVTDADVEGYPGLWLVGTGSDGLEATFPPYPLEEKLERDRDLRVVRAADYLAVTSGTRSYPWRVLGIARSDVDLVASSLTFLLASPSRIADPSWIRPGKVAWDWWNALNLRGVDFEAGVNDATYRHYIDFAAAHGIEYVILDEGWYVLGDVLKVVPGIDVKALADYGRQKGVGVILWVVWKTLADQLVPALDQFQRWGVEGIKVDFMQRDDQLVIDFYHRLCSEAAQRQLLVDFHGGIRPALMTRTWPNLISTEGVMGLEHDKWSRDVDPEHELTLPFTRMYLGPMDFTPGAMLNASRADFAPIFGKPMSQGTRCHQLAMYVVFESPLQMLADSPSHYAREHDAMEFLGPVPSVWDETRALDGRIGDYVLVARRSGTAWYVGAMTDWTARELTLDLSFLPEGAFDLDALEDGVNAGRNGSDYRRVRSSVDRSTRLVLRLAEGGGWAARLTPSR
jgi:alpha-glucosidase